MISVIIATKNRQVKLKDCINSILKNKFQNYEIIVIDQSDKPNDETLGNIDKIRYRRVSFNGKANSLNLGIKISRGSILAFTDDDCLVSPNWLSEIAASYKKFPKIGGVFGNVYAFQKKRGFRRVCPATISITKYKTHFDPTIVHYSKIGLGNNMSLKKMVLEKVGLFNRSLSPGMFSLGGGEDSDIIYRLLKNNVCLLSNPKIVVYHNRWLTGWQETKLQARYTAGLVAFYVNVFMKGNFKDAIVLFSSRFSERIIFPTKRLYWLSRRMIKDFLSIPFQIVAIVYGTIIGVIVYLRSVGKNKQIIN